MPISAPRDQDGVAAIRRFNRFYTQHLGVLRDGWFDSPFSLTEARVLYEIISRKGATATDIGRDLGLDAGYLSRILRRFQKGGLIRKAQSPEDARQSFLSITARGRKVFDPLEKRTEKQAGAVLGRLAATDRDRLVAAMGAIETLMTAEQKSAGEIVLREPRAGDLGWVVQRHGEIYAREEGWADNFEGLCAQIVADFSANFDPAWERCWIAEIDGANAGCVFLVKDTENAPDEKVARLRLLLVDPVARGRGLGTLLTRECVRFARERGYRRITLWTHRQLTAARHVYEQTGFTLTSSEAKRNFGTDVVSEHWDLAL